MTELNATAPAHHLMVWRKQIAEMAAHAPTTHTEHCMTYVVSGSVDFESGRPVRAEAGSLLLVPAGVPHRTLGVRDLDVWMVGFCAACLSLDESQRLMAPFERVRRGAMPVVPIAPERRAWVLSLYREIDAANLARDPEALEVATSLLRVLLGEACRAMPRVETAARAGSLVDEALGFIQRRGLEPISLRDVAAAVHRTPAHVTTTVRKATGYTVGEWISAARVSEAANWLLHSDESLDEIAARVGWQDKTHFIRQFRKAYGATPAAWRRQQRAGG